MNFQGKAVLVYLEEDNIARAYFRIQPLLTQDGNVTADMKAAYPDEGYLRIVPDKNEQHTFKERMRSMCGLCMLDLRYQPAEANKIRTNKNYSPSRGENNQYIIYSDAVRLIPDDLFYQVVAQADIKSAVTPYVYIRNGANIQGPVPRDEGKEAGATAQLPPDSSEIHSVTLHDGQELLFYWPKKEEAPAAEEEKQEAAPVPQPVAEEAPLKDEEEAPAAPETTALEQIREMNTGLSENANRLNAPAAAPMDFMPEQPQKPLTGTRLYQAPQRTAVPRRAHNPLMEAVDQQRYAAKYEAPGAVLPQSAQLKDVDNPIHALKRALQNVWQSADVQQQAIAVLLNQPGMHDQLAKALASETNDLTLAAMKSQLQEMEAERLMLLMQLDDVKKNMAAAREESLGQLAREEQNKLDQLIALQKKAQEDLAALEKAIPALEKQRQEAAEVIAAAQQLDATNVICPPVGTACTKAELIARMEKAMKAAGFKMEKGDALSMLVSFALSQKAWRLSADTLADAACAAHAFAAALGVPAYQNAWYNRKILQGGNTPVLLVDDGWFTPAPAATSVYISAQDNDPDEGNSFDFEGVPYACVTVAQDADALPQPLPAFAPVSKESVLKEMLKEGKLTDESASAVNALRKAIAAAGAPLSLASVDMLCRFIAAVQDDLGVAEALDRAVCLFVVPHLLVYQISVEEIKPLLAAMPRALKALKKA